jgi:uncharacterized protein (TIGR04255 family)
MTYTRAPLVLVLAEVRHPPLEVPTLAQMQVVKSALSDVLPLADEGVVKSLTVQADGRSDPTHEITQEQFRSLRSRDLRTALTVSRGSFSVETTDYRGWASFRVLLARVLNQRVAIGLPDGVSRVGLRYVDEVRLPASTDRAPNWSEWLNEQTAPPVPAGLNLTVAQQQSVVLYETGRPGETLTLRYGAVNGPPAVIGPARPNAPGPGHYFLLDTDAAWQPVDSIPEFDPPWILEAYDQLHTGVSDLFESMLTPRVRKEVFGGE